MDGCMDVWMDGWMIITHTYIYIYIAISNNSSTPSLRRYDWDVFWSCSFVKKGGHNTRTTIIFTLLILDYCII